MDRIPEFTRRMLLEQLEVSSQAVDDYLEDYTEEGSKQLYYHAEIIKSIKERLEIYLKSNEDAKKLDQEMSKIYK